MERTKAEAIVDDIIENLCDRRGLSHEWFNIDGEIQSDIRSTWIEIVMLRRPT